LLYPPPNSFLPEPVGLSVIVILSAYCLRCLGDTSNDLVTACTAGSFHSGLLNLPLVFMLVLGVSFLISSFLSSSLPLPPSPLVNCPPLESPLGAWLGLPSFNILLMFSSSSSSKYFGSISSFFLRVVYHNLHTVQRVGDP
jgi:hypothetical protein